MLIEFACQVKVRVAGTGVCYRAAWGVVHLTCRHESTFTIVINSRNINVPTKYMKNFFSSNKEKVWTKHISCMEWGRHDLHTSDSITALCYRNGIRYTLASPMLAPHAPHAMTLTYISSIGLLTISLVAILGWNLRQWPWPSKISQL